jgi:uncharacterized protein (DUF1810 family)
MPPKTLERFRLAQDGPDAGFESALAELGTTGKRGHWIWYIFPQIEGLGTSPTAREYAIRDADEAADYLYDSVLRSRLLAVTRTIAEQLERGQSLEELMRSRIDAVKTVSSLTLFERVADRLRASNNEPDEYSAVANAAGRVLSLAEAQGHPRCRFTLQRLGG